MADAGEAPAQTQKRAAGFGSPRVFLCYSARMLLYIGLGFAGIARGQNNKRNEYAK